MVVNNVILCAYLMGRLRPVLIKRRYVKRVLSFFGRMG